MTPPTDHAFEPLPHRARGLKSPYSLARAVLHQSDPNRRALDGLEGEVSAEIARRSGRTPQGFFVPLDAFVPVHRRALDTAAGAGGIATIVGPVLDVLRPKTVLAELGATVYPDLTGGKFALPVKGSAVSLGWCGESANPPNSNPQITAQAAFAPHTVGAYVDISNRALASIPSAESIVTDDLLTSIGVEIDRVALNGKGTVATLEPLGLLQDPAVPRLAFSDPDGGAPTHALLCEMERVLGNNNGDRETTGFLTSPNGRSKLRRTFENGTGSKAVWRNDGTVLGYPARASTLVPSAITKGASAAALSACLIGNFADLRIGLWGAVDVIVNPYLLSSNGVTRVTALLDADVNVCRPNAFVSAFDMATT